MQDNFGTNAQTELKTVKEDAGKSHVYMMTLPNKERVVIRAKAVWPDASKPRVELLEHFLVIEEEDYAIKDFIDFCVPRLNVSAYVGQGIFMSKSCCINVNTVLTGRHMKVEDSTNTQIPLGLGRWLRKWHDAGRAYK